MPETFDPNTFTDPSLKKQYDYMLERTRTLYNSFASAYTEKSKNKDIQIDYISSRQFQARAFKISDTLYTVSMHSPVLMVLRNLFDVLFAFDEISAEISGKLSKVIASDIPLVHDLRNISDAEQTPIKTDSDRLLVSSILTDFIGTFIMLHEIGHVVSGHVDGNSTYFKENEILEVFDNPKSGVQKKIDIKQAMEFDADMIATRLIPKYIEQLHHKIQEDKRYQKAFKNTYNSDYPFEKLTALCLASLFALFVYTVGKIQHIGCENSYHPHPLTRAQYIKNGIIQTIKERHQINQEVLVTVYLDHIDAVLICLESLDMYNADLFNEAYFDNADHDLERIQKIASENRKLFEKWSWLPKDEWC
ncbi:MAG: hypothetical protein Mars2KO_05060 [Maribacter sp.]